MAASGSLTRDDDGGVDEDIGGDGRVLIFCQTCEEIGSAKGNGGWDSCGAGEAKGGAVKGELAGGSFVELDVL